MSALQVVALAAVVAIPVALIVCAGLYGRTARRPSVAPVPTPAERMARYLHARGSDYYGEDTQLAKRQHVGYAIIHRQLCSDPAYKYRKAGKVMQMTRKKVARGR